MPEVSFTSGESVDSASEVLGYAFQIAADLFAKKNKDYGEAWRCLRVTSLTDQMLIKLLRIRSIEEKGEQLVSDSIGDECIALVNYGAIAILRLRGCDRNMGYIGAESIVGDILSDCKDLAMRKNHDYGEAWRVIRPSSLTDLMLQKIERIKSIEDNGGLTIASEGLEANYADIVNYAAYRWYRFTSTQQTR